MTKFEWERALRSLLKDMPSDEVKRIMEYYDELFMDAIDEGKSETEAIAGFGAPEDVARKIISESVDEEKSEKKSDEKPGQRVEEVKAEEVTPKSEKKELDVGKIIGLVFSIILKVLWKGLAIFGVAALAVTFACFAVGLIGTGVISAFGAIGREALSVVANVGLSLVGIGVGVILLPLVYKVFVWAIRKIVELCKSFVSELRQEGADIYED